MCKEKRIVFITGSGRRVGRQLAFAFADQGYDIILHANESRQGMHEAADAILRRGKEAHCVVGDLRNVTDIRRMADEIASISDTLDVLVNNAGVFPEASFEAVTEEMWDLALDVNTKAVFFVTQCLLPLLRNAKGSIVNVISAGAYEPWSGHIPYNVSKAATVMLTRALAKSLAPDIRVNGVAPGVIVVPDEEERRHIPEQRFLLRRYGTPRDLADAVLFLAHGTTYITGHIIPVSGGGT